ncbi:MAG: hypothetical protein ACQEXJ_13695 [Myxococcota bacterium]
MKDDGVDRRRFLGLGLAAAGGAVLGGTLALTGPARLRWERRRGFPDGPATLALDLPGLPDGTRVPLHLRVRTPREELRLPAGEAVIRDGRARVDVPLTYPYERRIQGTYAYRAEADLGGRRVATAETAGYSVRRMMWFS